MSNRIPNSKIVFTPPKTTIIVFIIFNFLFSLNFGFVQKRWAKILSLCIYMANSIILTTYIMFNVHHWSFFEFWFGFGLYIVYYSVLVLILFFNGNKLTFYEYLCRLQKLDLKLLSNKEAYPSFEAKLCLIGAFNFFVRTATNIIYCCQYSKQCVSSIYLSLYYLQLFILAFDIVAFVNSLVFNLAYYRLKKFVNLVKGMKQTSQRMNVNYFLLYKELIDLTEEIKTAFDPLFAINFLFTFPLIVATSYVTIVGIKEDNIPIVSSFVLIQILSVTQSTFLVLTPTIFGGMLSYKAKELKIELQNQALFEQDTIQRDTIERFIKYVEMRDFNFQVYGVIPLQPQLFMSVMNVCIGYLIIIIQLTHLD